jgi:hypothetical protein
MKSTVKFSLIFIKILLHIISKTNIFCCFDTRAIVTGYNIRITDSDCIKIALNNEIEKNKVNCRKADLTLPNLHTHLTLT